MGQASALRALVLAQALCVPVLALGRGDLQGLAQGPCLGAVLQARVLEPACKKAWVPALARGALRQTVEGQRETAAACCAAQVQHSACRGCDA